jgi:MoxR-like ATPase
MVSSDSVETSRLIDKLDELRRNIERVFFGKPDVVSHLLIGLLGRGHVLIEDVPGVGKTVLARALARSIDCGFARLQLTPDLLPSDILGVSVYNEAVREFEFKKGPIFTNIILADEINRTTPRTQSALLEAMNEAQVSMDGRTMLLERPFMVIATQNPFEYEGTYFLPENQLDRFTLRIRIGYPDREVERRILYEDPSHQALESLGPVMDRREVVQLQDMVASVRVDDDLISYGLHIVEATRKDEHLEVGVSPRGTLALVRAAQAGALLAGRDYVVPDDLKSLVVPCFAHRVMGKSFLQNGRAADNEQILHAILERVAVP